MKIIEGAMDARVLEEAQNGARWDSMVVRAPVPADPATVAVLIVPVAPGYAEAARAKIEEALRVRGE